jgi:hypothetical protein
MSLSPDTVACRNEAVAQCCNGSEQQQQQQPWSKLWFLRATSLYCQINMVTDLQSCWMQSYMNETEPRKDPNSLDQFEFVNKQGQVFRLRSRFCRNMSCHMGTSFLEEKNIKENQPIIHLLENRHNNT